MLHLLLSVLVVLSALAVVRVKFKNRELVTQMDQLRGERERINMEWSQLQLEEATLASHSRVERIAREQLGMTEPKDYVTVSARP
ncbi:MAG TPA: cell division protein FtsL [Stenotrophobium sp.]|jgi:cell division protein FtsL|nr:cell division protein FtsL [Stenotrophobium sp.]